MYFHSLHDIFQFPLRLSLANVWSSSGLIDFQIFEDFLDNILLQIFKLILLLIENIFWIVSVILHLIRLILWPPSPPNVVCLEECSMCIWREWPWPLLMDGVFCNLDIVGCCCWSLYAGSLSHHLFFWLPRTALLTVEYVGWGLSFVTGFCLV